MTDMVVKIIADLEQQLAAETNNKQEFERDWLTCCDKLNDERRIHLELEETLVKKLEAAQAREKVLLEALNYCADNVPEFWTVPGVKAALNQPTDDIALQDLILKERTRAVDTYKHLHQELVLKDALAAERDKCPLHDAADIATKAMRKAWQLGQTYWQQADSDSYKQNAKSAITQDSFNDLLDSTAEAIRALED